MKDRLDTHKLEVREESMSHCARFVPSSRPMQLLVVNLVEETPIKHCCGVMLDEDEIPKHISPAQPNHVERFEEALQRGEFMLQIPQSCFRSDVLETKLLNTPPAQRKERLKALMCELGLNRLLIVAPTDAEHYQELALKG